MYGKIQDGVFIQAPKILKDSAGKVHYNPTEKLYFACGYLPIIEAEYPQTDEEAPKAYEKVFTQHENRIEVTWEEVTPSEKSLTPISFDERLSGLEADLGFTMEAVDFLLMKEGE